MRWKDRGEMSGSIVQFDGKKMENEKETKKEQEDIINTTIKHIYKTKVPKLENIAMSG